MQENVDHSFVTAMLRIIASLLMIKGSPCAIVVDASDDDETTTATMPEKRSL